VCIYQCLLVPQSNAWIVRDADWVNGWLGGSARLPVLQHPRARTQGGRGWQLNASNGAITPNPVHTRNKEKKKQQQPE
jgi:hypothetical protein